ncbi:MAG: Maf-like protein [Candidatus Sericytochromatia bacterium]|nr:MAG: Maf-like protein [Candidatus Sericytochromatia bacterium]
MKIVLASSSPRRKDLLSYLGIDFIIKSISIDESFDNNLSVIDNVKKLALNKARAVKNLFKENHIIIGADTIVLINDLVLGKPKDKEEAKYMLSLLSGNKHQVITSIALVPTDKDLEETVSYCKTNVYFKKLSIEEINNYVLKGECMDKAGAYALQGIGSVFISKIEGCYTNVIGLSLPLLSDMLKKYNINLI